MKKIWYAMMVAVLVCVTLTAVFSTSGEAYAYDIPYTKFDKEEFTELNYGIYWYRSGSDVPVKDSELFDPDKPTLLYTHGMKMGSESVDVREGLSLKDVAPSKLSQYGYDPYPYEDEFYEYYIEQGYNVGVFYWNQLASTFALSIEEDKIWATNPSMSMTYTYRTGSSYKTTKAFDDTNPECSLTTLYKNAYIEALGEDYSEHIQLVGHSMGGQLTFAMGEALCVAYDNGEIGENLLPDRMTVLDPFIGSSKIYGEIDFLGVDAEGKAAVTLTAEAAQVIAEHGIPIEGYATNDIAYHFYDMGEEAFGGLFKDQIKPFSDADGNPDPEGLNRVKELLGKNVAWVHMDALIDKYAGILVPSHTLTVDYYFTTNYLENQTDANGMIVPSAKVSDEDILALRGITFNQYYNEELSNPNPLYSSDCIFVRADNVTQEDIVGKPMARITGFTGAVDKEYTVKLCKRNEVVETVQTVGGRYAFDYVTAADYTVKVYAGTTLVGTKEIGVTGYDLVTCDVEVKAVDTVIWIYLSIALGAALVIAAVVSVSAYVLRKKGSRRS